MSEKKSPVATGPERKEKGRNLLAAAAADGVRRDRHHLPRPAAAVPLRGSPPSAPRRLLRPGRRRLQAERRRRGGGCRSPQAVQAAAFGGRAHGPRAVRPLLLALLQGRGHGAGDERGDGERLDDGVGDGGSADGRRRREPAGGVDAAVVALHKVPAAADAGGLHLQRLRAAHHARHQPARLHRRHCVRSVLRLQHLPQAGGQPEPVPRDEVLRRPRLPLRGGRPVQLP